VTADVRELYPSIPIDEGISALRSVLQHRMHYDDDTINFICDLAAFVLRNNIFKYEDQLYIQIFGTAMGTCFAPAYATIYLHVIETEIWHSFINNIIPQEYPILIKRYIDDLFGIFKTETSLQTYINLYNEARPSIKLEITGHGDDVNILDLNIFKGHRFHSSGLLDIKLFQKDMNRYLYIPPDSFHTQSTIKGFILSEIRRARICCTNDADYITAKENLYRRLLNRGYDPSFLHPLFHTEVERRALLAPLNFRQQETPIVFIIENSPRFSHGQLKDIIQFPVELEQHPLFEKIFHNQQPMICYKRSANIKDKLK
jgi:hypothetical protein